MSMNVHIIGTRKIKVIKTRKTETQRIYFYEWQTPTNDSYRILNSADPIQSYRNWVLERAPDMEEREPEYAPDDWLCERDPIGETISNAALEHIQELDEWIAESEAEGYKISVEVW